MVDFLFGVLVGVYGHKLYLKLVVKAHELKDTISNKVENFKKDINNDDPKVRRPFVRRMTKRLYGKKRNQP
jgi:hypothetical protein